MLVHSLNQSVSVSLGVVAMLITQLYTIEHKEFSTASFEHKEG
jgi:hypothetical protein